MKTSLTKILAALPLGGRHYTETTLEARTTKNQTITASISRRKDLFGSKKFTTTLCTCLGAKPGDIRYLVCVERVL